MPLRIGSETSGIIHNVVKPSKPAGNDCYSLLLNMAFFLGEISKIADVNHSFCMFTRGFLSFTTGRGAGAL